MLLQYVLDMQVSKTFTVVVVGGGVMYSLFQVSACTGVHCRRTAQGPASAIYNANSI